MSDTLRVYDILKVEVIKSAFAYRDHLRMLREREVMAIIEFRFRLVLSLVLVVEGRRSMYGVEAHSRPQPLPALREGDGSRGRLFICSYIYHANARSTRARDHL